MPKDFNTWIDRYNKAKGWTKIVVPPGTAGAARSPEKEIKSLLEQSKAEEARLAKELGEADAIVTDFVRKVRDEVRDLEKFRLENDLKIAQGKQKKLSYQHDIATELTLKRARLLQQRQEIDAAIRKGILDVHVEIDAISSKKRRATPPGHAKRTSYDARRAMILAKIDKARDTPIKMRDPKLADAKVYNSISAPDYTLLITMLQKADAYAGGDEVPAAEKVLDATLAKLDELVLGRLGWIVIKESPDRNPEIAGPVGQAKQAIAAIRSAGLGRTADLMKVELEQLTYDFEHNSKARDRLGLSEKEMIQPHQAFATRCTEAAGKLGAYKAVVAEIGALIADLRRLGDDDRADRYETEWTARDQSGDVDAELKAAESRLGLIRTTVGVVRDGVLSQDNINPLELKKQFDGIKANVEAMYKHHSDGTRRTIEDAKSWMDKHIKKDSDIPREAFDELEMRVKMADLLLESNSVDAVKRAGTYLADLDKFQTDMKDHSSEYETTRKAIEVLQSDFGVFQKRYTDYLLDDRSELKIATDAFDKDYKKQAPETNAKKLKELQDKSANIRIEAKELKSNYKLFGKEAETLQKALDKFGKSLTDKKCASGQGDRLTGYYGELTKQLAKARAEAEKRNKAGLTDALTQLDDIKASLAEQSAIVKTLLKDGLASMGDDDKKAWYAIRNDAFAGQAAHDQNEKQKVVWEKDHPVVKARLKAIKEKFTTLKLDPTDIDLAIMEYDAIVAEQKISPDYNAAMKELDRIKKNADGMETRATELATFKADPVDKAAKLVCDNLRAFLAFVDSFETKIKAADPAADAKYDLSNLKTYLALVKSAVPDAAIKGLEDTTKEIAKDTSLSTKSRELREQALAHVRLINNRLRTSAVIKHFEQQTFVADSTLDIALDALGRLQVKLLTALK